MNCAAARGELTFQVGADRVVGRAGDTLFVPRGVHHTLANLAGSSARYLLVCTPGGFEQRFGPEADSTPSGPATDVIVVGPRIPEMDAGASWAASLRRAAKMSRRQDAAVTLEAR